MASSKFEPKLDQEAFNCPFCYAYAHFHWSNVTVNSRIALEKQIEIGHKAAQCSHCKQWTLWTIESKNAGPVGILNYGRLVHPFKVNCPLPHRDLPESCRTEYEEARQVFAHSPRGSAALLRLCVQILCKELGEAGKNINTDIGSLVKKGLDPGIQKALDIVRVSGNNAVHPGVMDIGDDSELVQKLFNLVNMVVQEMITKPKELEKMYKGLPEEATKAIKKRDKR